MPPAARVAASTIDLLRQRKDPAGEAWIGPAQHMAGERLASDLRFAGMLPKVTMDWSRGAPLDTGGSAPGLNPTEAAMAARQRAGEALRAIGPEFSGVLMDLCGFDKGLETIERERNWPVRSAKVVVRLALASLARHYGYGDTAHGAPSRRNAVWHAPGPRSSLAGRQ